MEEEKEGGRDREKQSEEGKKGVVRVRMEREGAGKGRRLAEDTTRPIEERGSGEENCGAGERGRGANEEGERHREKLTITACHSQEPCNHMWFDTKYIYTHLSATTSPFTFTLFFPSSHISLGVRIMKQWFLSFILSSNT